jgi:hypothetical protein
MQVNTSVMMSRGLLASPLSYPPAPSIEKYSSTAFRVRASQRICSTHRRLYCSPLHRATLARPLLGARSRLGRAPKWLQKPVGATFGFGGKLASFTMAAKPVAPGTSYPRLIRTYAHTYAHISTHTFSPISTYIYTYICKHTHTCTYVHTHRSVSFLTFTPIQ